MAPQVRFGVLYDFRCPPGSTMPLPELYARTLDQIKTVDTLGYDSVWISEHHFVDDGYMPSLMAISGAIAAVTNNVKISQDILLIPFQHPVRLAEDLCVLDNLTGGRMMLGAGMGYVHEEFAAMGIDRRTRVSRMDEGLEIVQRAFREPAFSYKGKRFQLDNVRVRPRPVQDGGPPIWIAAMSEAGAHRAARFRANLLPQGDRAAVLDPWIERVNADGQSPDDYRVGILRGFIVADDPEAERARWMQSAAADGERYVQRLYGKWITAADDRMTSQLAEGRESGREIPQSFFFGSPDQCINEIERFASEYHLTDLILRGVSPGQPPEEALENLERFARDVMPHFNAP